MAQCTNVKKKIHNRRHLNEAKKLMKNSSIPRPTANEDNSK